MTWSEARACAARVLRDLRAQFGDRDLRLILRALTRDYHTTKTKEPMTQPQIIVSELGPDRFQIDVYGRFGGGFRNLTTNRAGVIYRLSLLKSYDCGSEPAAVIVPAALEADFRKVFPESFA